MLEQGYVAKRSLTQRPLYTERSPLLERLDIELTERCNNACMHCYINLPATDPVAESRELSTGQWKDILIQAADLGALTVRFTGGEPLLRADFAELYLYARRLGMKVMLFTNARRITPELADLFARFPPLKKIEISVYGMHPESYDAVACAPGAYAEFRRGVDLLLERRVPFIVKSAILPPNLNEVDEFEAWAASLPWSDLEPGYATLLDLRTRRDSPARNRLISQLRMTPDENLSFLSRRGQKYQNELAGFCSRFICPPGDRLFTCGAGESVCIDAYGSAQMCMMLRYPDTVFPISQGSLREVLTEVFSQHRQLRATNPDYLDRCARCFLKGLCDQCPAKSWAEHGSLDTPVDYFCQVAHAQARFLGLLGEGEWGWEVTDWQERIVLLEQKVNLDPIISTSSPRSLPSQG